MIRFILHIFILLLTPFILKAQTIVDIVVNSDVHNTLETAVIEAGLVETLQGDGPFTLFAPTDAAFEALPEGVLDALLDDPEGDLTDILLYHTVSGSTMADDLTDNMKVTTVSGSKIRVHVIGEDVLVNGALVTVKDIAADNGIVHVIDAVLQPYPASVVDVVVNSDVHNTLETAVLTAGLAETLQGEGPFTLFAPTDDAFDALPEGVLQSLLDDPQGALTDILLYHALSGEAQSTDLSDGQKVVTIAGNQIRINLEDDKVFINDAEVTVANILTENGIVHVIDAVLLPYPANVVDVVVNSDVHNTLETAVLTAGLAETLQGEGPFTLFAPTDDAFDALPEGVLQSLLDDPQGALTDILLYHALSGEAQSADLSDGQKVVTIAGNQIRINLDDDKVFINDAEVTIANILTDNGVVHVIDAVLLPYPSNVVEVVVNSDVHNTLETAVIAAGLVETLEGEGPFTLFAPTDDAFAALPEGVLQSLLDDPQGALADALLYHVVSGAEAQSESLEDRQKVVSAAGNLIRIFLEDDKVFINDAEVIIADILTDNGVVHVIDAVILPYPATVVDVVVNSDVHGTLEALVGQAGLIETLQGEGPFTLFAPTDDAFAKLDPALVTELTDAPDTKLSNVLLYHALAGTEVFAEDLFDGLTAETAFGQDITITIDGETALVNNAEIVTTDILTDNGIIHVITDVLLPTGVVSNNEINFEKLSLIPNPVSDFIQIKLGENIENNTKVEIYNALGQVLMTQELVNDFTTIDMTEYQKGSYFIKVSNDVKSTVSQVTKL